MGSTDKMIRLAIAAIIGILHYMGIITGTLGLVLLVVAIIFAVTSFINFCPLYAIFGINTCKIKE